MKKILLSVAVFISLGAGAQIDTVLIRGNTSLRADVWCWELGKHQNAINADSVTKYHYGRIAGLVFAAKAQIQANGWGYVIAIDSIPGNIALEIYRTILGAAGGEIAPYYAAAKTELEGKTNLLPYLIPVRDNRSGDFERFRDVGRWIAEPRPL